MRTTSSLESFNAVLNRSIAKHSHFFKFVPRLKIHESRKADKMFNLAHDILPNDHDQFKRRKKCDQQREEKIKYFTTKYLIVPITENSVREFLLAMASDDNGTNTFRSYFHLPNI